MKMELKSDFVIASCSVPVNYDYTRLNVENHLLALRGAQQDNNIGSTDRSDNISNSTSSNLRVLGRWLIS
jgi:hypothetical protein